VGLRGVGRNDGLRVIFLLGRRDLVFDGLLVGRFVGYLLGRRDGDAVGLYDTVGTAVGLIVGDDIGFIEIDGILLIVGAIDGRAVGDEVPISKFATLTRALLICPTLFSQDDPISAS
jgi:hypothetical protein